MPTEIWLKSFRPTYFLRMNNFTKYNARAVAVVCSIVFGSFIFFLLSHESLWTLSRLSHIFGVHCFRAKFRYRISSFGVDSAVVQLHQLAAPPLNAWKHRARTVTTQNMYFRFAVRSSFELDTRNFTGHMRTRVLARTLYHTRPFPPPLCLHTPCLAMLLYNRKYARDFFSRLTFFLFYFYFLIESQPVLKCRPLWYAIALSFRCSRTKLQTHTICGNSDEIIGCECTPSRDSVAMWLPRNCSRRPRTKYVCT